MLQVSQKTERMRLFILLSVLAISDWAYAQTSIEKSVPVQTGQKLVLEFDYPELIELSTWDRKEILIKGQVSINKGENDDAFELHTLTSGNTVTIRSGIKDKDDLPKRIVIKKGDTEYVFKAKDTKDPEIQKFFNENGREYSYMSTGVLKEITLEVYVPTGMDTNVEAKYGLVEVTGFNAPLTVSSHYGGVDATVNVKATGELTARTYYGEILTNMDILFNSKRQPSSGFEKWTEISAIPATGPRFLLESKYGKVYLRKSN